MRNNSPQDDPLTPSAPTEGQLTRDPSTEGAKGTTPGGQTGIDDLRHSSEEHGSGRVADAAGVRSFDAEHHYAPSARLSDDPSAEDPYSTPQPSEEVLEMERADPTGQGYPSYEIGQDWKDHATGGATDTHDFMTHANSGDETVEPEED